MNSLLKQLVIGHKRSLSLLITRMSSEEVRKEIKIPQKLTKFPEMSDEFMAQRQTHVNNNPNLELSIDSFKELIVDKDSEESVKEIIDFYNTKMIKTLYYPSIVTIKEMDYMLNKLNSYSLRLKYLRYLFIREFDVWRYERQDIQRRAEKEVKEKHDLENFGQIGCFNGNNEINYGYWRNTMFSRYFTKSVHKYSLNHLRNASLFGQKLVIDCSFDQEMEEYEAMSAARQMARIYSINRRDSKEPFDLHFCSCDENSRIFEQFMKIHKNIAKSAFLNCHSESYSDLFANHNLVYLTPDAKPILHEFDHNAVYILGSIVGKTCKLPLTAFKAKREGLPHYRLPIHLYVRLKPQVKKVLSFQGVFKTLLEVKDHGNWELAFMRGIQEHKLKSKDEE